LVEVGDTGDQVALPEARPLRLRPAERLIDDQRWWWLGGVITLALAALWWVARQRQQRAATVPPYERARRAVVAAAGLGDGREAAAALGLALRRLAGETWGFDGAGSTVRETAANLRRLAAPDQPGRELVRLLERLDERRWQPGELPAGILASDVEAALSWVDGRRIEAEAAAKLAAAGGR